MAPLFIQQLAFAMGVSIAAAWAWYNTQSTEDQRRIRKNPESYNQNDIDNEEEEYDCDEVYQEDTSKCNNVTQQKGRRAGAICHESASERYAKCSRGRPEDEWPILQS